MNNYTIATQITVNKDIELYLLNIAANIRHINKSIIPSIQINEINNYKIKHDSDKRLLVRSFLYEYLTKYYGITNFELDFTKYLKPFLKAAPYIHFSFSYAKDYALIGISAHKKLGIDIEYINPTLQINEIAPSIMCSSELKQFNAYSNNSYDQRVYFFQLFSAKESIIKAFGTGLYFDVKNLNIIEHNQFMHQHVQFKYHKLEQWMHQYTLAACYEY